MTKALIRFPNGLEKACIGGIKDRKSVPFNESEWHRHIKALQAKGYEISILKFIEA